MGRARQKSSAIGPLDSRGDIAPGVMLDGYISRN